MGDFNFTDINWEYQLSIQTAPGNSYCTLKLTSWYRHEGERCLQDLLFVNREGLLSKVAIGVCLGQSDHEVGEFKIVGDRRKTPIKMSSLDMRTDVRLLTTS